MEKSVFWQRDLLNIDAIEDGKALGLKRLKSLILSKPFPFMPFEKYMSISEVATAYS